MRFGFSEPGQLVRKQLPNWWARATLVLLAALANCLAIAWGQTVQFDGPPTAVTPPAIAPKLRPVSETIQPPDAPLLPFPQIPPAVAPMTRDAALQPFVPCATFNDDAPARNPVGAFPQPTPQVEFGPQPKPLELPPQTNFPGARVDATNVGAWPAFGASRLPGQLGVIGSTPVPTPQTVEMYAKHIRGLLDPMMTLDLAVGRTRLMTLNDMPKRIQVADETIAAFSIISPREISLIGKCVGVTVLTMWFGDGVDESKQEVLTYHVRVIPDPEMRKHLEWVYKQLADEINRAFPDSVVCLNLVGDKVVLTGHAKDFTDAGQILKLVQAQGYTSTRSGPRARDVGRIPVDRPKTNPAELGPDGLLPPATDQFEVAAAPLVVNLLKVDGEQQVMLRVTVAEVNRAAARSIGMNFTVNTHIGPVVANNTGNIALGGTASLYNTGGIAGIGGVGGSAANGLNGISPIPGIAEGLGGFNNLAASVDRGEVLLAISALRELNYAKSLAEPNLVALNGQTAHFLAGGQFPVPTVTGNTYNGLQGVSFVPYGVQLNFTPYILDRNRVRLVMAADVTTRDLDNGAVTIGGTSVPNLNTRSFQTTVELCEGQTLAVAGLIQSNLGGDADRIPWLGDLPYIGRLFSFDRVSAGEQELVVLITPQLVHPMMPDEIPALPGSDLIEPTDLEFYLQGHLEGRSMPDWRSPVRTDWGRLHDKFQQTESIYISGPHGQD